MVSIELKLLVVMTFLDDGELATAIISKTSIWVPTLMVMIRAPCTLSLMASGTVSADLMLAPPSVKSRITF
jgi:hypothetical protein